jgi:hypothetical protein
VIPRGEWGDMRNAYQILVRKLNIIYYLGHLGINVKLTLKLFLIEYGLICIELAQNSVQRRDPVDRVINLPLSKTQGIF